MTDSDPPLQDPSTTVRAYLASQILWGVHVASVHGLSISEYATLMVLQLAGTATPAELAETTHLSPAAVSRMITRLSDRGFVVRETDPDDRRRTIISISPDWVETAEDAARPHREANMAVMYSLTPAERAAVFGWMARATSASLSALDED